VDKPGLRCPNIDAFELILGGDDPLPQFSDFALRLLQVFEHFGLKVLIELEDLQFGFADLAAPLGRFARCIGRARLPDEPYPAREV